MRKVRLRPKLKIHLVDPDQGPILDRDLRLLDPVHVDHQDLGLDHDQNRDLVQDHQYVQGQVLLDPVVQDPDQALPGLAVQDLDPVQSDLVQDPDPAHLDLEVLDQDPDQVHPNPEDQGLVQLDREAHLDQSLGQGQSRARGHLHLQDLDQVHLLDPDQVHLLLQDPVRLRPNQIKPKIRLLNKKRILF